MKFGRVISVIVLTLVLTTLGVGASDSLRGVGGGLVAQLIGANSEAGCPSGMVPIATALTFSCVDQYEASTADTCTIREPESAIDTRSNLGEVNCKADSVAERVPWRYITREQAMTACAKAGKRLPSASEWYQVSLGTEVQKCNVTSLNILPTGEATQCISALHIFDAIGNVWEWVSDDVIEGEYHNRTIPPSGYITQVDASGVATVTTIVHSASTTSGYFWSNTTGAYGLIRGGFYSSQSDAGIDTVQAATSPSFSGAAIGFRCVR